MDYGYFTWGFAGILYVQPIILLIYAFILSIDTIDAPSTRLQIMGLCWGTYTLVSRGAILAIGLILSNLSVECICGLIPMPLAWVGWLLTSGSLGPNKSPVESRVLKIESLSRVSLFIEIVFWLFIYLMVQTFLREIRT